MVADLCLPQAASQQKKCVYRKRQWDSARILADAVLCVDGFRVNIYMRAILLILLLTGCAVPVAELRQSAAEGASGVVYAVAEPTVPESMPRPPARPSQLHLTAVSQTDPLTVAAQYLGYTETEHRSQLREFLGVDPRRTEWCAAFVNSVIAATGGSGSESVSEYPLLARSFLEWGIPVDHKQEDPKPGDVVIFPRGRQSWQGHVGFYVDTVSVDGKLYWQILGGNQSNSVSMDLYVPARALGVRRAPEPVVITRNLFDVIRSWFV